MPKRAKVGQLPPEVKEWLDTALIGGDFSNYELLEAELSERGYQIGKSSIHRYGQKLERKLAAIKASTDAAAAIAKAAPDDSDLRSAAVISLVQTEVFDVLLQLQELQEAEEGGGIDAAERVKLLSRVAKSIAELSRASVNQKRWQVAMQDKARAAAEAVDAVARKGGLTDESLEMIRRNILGILN